MVIYAMVPQADASNVSTAPVTSTTIPFEKYYDIESGNLFNQAGQNPGTNFDLKFGFNNNSTVGARLVWNGAGANMAVVTNKGFDLLKSSDITLYYYCQNVEDNDNACSGVGGPPTNFTGIIQTNEGNYFANNELLQKLEDKNLIAFKYCNAMGSIEKNSNPNGSSNNIAGILNTKKNILGMMPHPERLIDPLLSGEDGSILFKSLLNSQ